MRRAYLVTYIGLAVVAVVALTLAYTLGPEPLTGDPAADAACNALGTVGTENGKASATSLMTMGDEERAEVVREIASHAEESTIEGIRDAGLALAAGNMTSGGLFGNLGFAMGLAQFAEACAAAGWTPERAGLVGGVEWAPR